MHPRMGAAELIRASLVPLVGGALGGWMLGSLVESFFHQHLGHAGRRLRHWFTCVPGLGRWLSNAYEAHTNVHHSWTFRADQVTQFHPERNPREQVDARILAHGLDLADLRSELYGLSLNLVGFAKFSLPFVATWLPLAWCLWSTLPLACLAALVTMLLAPAFSTWVHPCLHLRYDDAIRKARWPFNYVLDSSYGRLLWVYHDMHHRRPKCNFNLMLGFGDVVRGCARMPTRADKRRAAMVGGPPMTE